MLLILYRFLREQSGQDMVEYVLVLAMVTLAAAAMYIGVGGSVDALWRVMNSRMTNAAS
jgi:Flp pilus assembly pilin Flp